MSGTSNLHTTDSRTAPQQMTLWGGPVNGWAGRSANASVGEPGVGPPGLASVASLRGGGSEARPCSADERVHGTVHHEGNSACQCHGQEGSSRELTGSCPSSAKPPDLPEEAIAHLRSVPEPEEPAEASPTSLAHLASEYEIRARLRPHVADLRVAACGCIVYGDPAVVTTEYGDGTRKARWTGVILCNRAGCPVCGAIRARRFGEKVRRTLGSGGLWQHVILTVPHQSGESWSTVYDRLLHGVRDITKGQAGKVLRGIQQATIRATESTWSDRSGWHVHFHCLWRLRRPLMAAELEVVEDQWCERTGAEKHYGLRLGAAFYCDNEQNRNWAAKYVSKLSLELSGAAKSAHPEHWSLGEIFSRAAHARDDDDRMFLDLVDEYQASTKGRRIYQLDRRAMRLHDAAPELPERTIVNEWRTSVFREEFSGLSRVERHKRVWDAIYLPLEAAATARGDPALEIAETIDGILRGYDARRKCDH